MDNMQVVEAKIEWKEMFLVPVAAPFVGSYPVYTEENFKTCKCTLNVHVQGNFEQLEDKIVFLTVHDVGKTYSSFAKLAKNETIAPLVSSKRALFVHVSVPGQELGTDNFTSDNFPSMEHLGNALAQVVEQLKLPKCVAIGEGAGADIVSRFAMNFPEMVVGAVLVHCTSTTHGIVATIKELFTNLLLNDGEMSHSAWNWFLVYKFGNHEMNDQQRKFVDAVKASGLNQYNLSRYLYAFGHRDDFTDRLKDQLGKVDVHLITGAKSPHNENVLHMFNHMNKASTDLHIAEGVFDVVDEAPDYIANSMVLLCRRHGLLPK